MEKKENHTIKFLPKNAIKGAIKSIFQKNSTSTDKRYMTSGDETLGKNDLDEYLRGYNQDRAHQGRNMNGRTPNQAFIDGLPNPKKSKKKDGLKGRLETTSSGRQMSGEYYLCTIWFFVLCGSVSDFGFKRYIYDANVLSVGWLKVDSYA